MKAYSQAAVILFVSVVISLGIFFSAPEPVSAQSFWDSVSCTGTDCQMCHFVQLANVIVDWLVRVLLLVFGIVAVVAGFGLVTSAGNPAAKNQAKDRMTNAFIGFLIVLAAWMAVDALLRGLAGDDFGAGGDMAWNDIECVDQPNLKGYSNSFNFSSTLACASSGGTYDCSAQIEACLASNPNADAQYNSSGDAIVCNSTGSYSDSQYDDAEFAAGDCSPENLQNYGFTPTQANVMSCISTPESGCNNNADASDNGLNSSARGVFQIVYGYNDDCHSLRLPECTAANGGVPLNCGKSDDYAGSACNKAASNFACNAAAAKCLLNGEASGVAPGYQHWTADHRASAQAACIAKYGG